MSRIERNKYLEELKNKMNNGAIKIVTGLRRVGKSYLLGNIFFDYLLSQGVKEKQIIKFDFSSQKDLLLIGEDYLKLKEEHRKVNSKKFISYIDKKCKNNGATYFILLDEVQELESFEYVLIGLLSLNNYDIYVTGSNAKFLSKDVITEFRGKGDEIHLLPLSFSECYKYYDDNPKEALNKYLIYGGLPMVVLSKTDIDRRNYLNKQIQETYLADIIERYKVNEVDDLNELLLYIASSSSRLVNPKKLASRFLSIKHSSISEPTISKYIRYFEEIFLINKALRYDIKGSSYISTPYKIYFEDVGVRNAILNYRQVERTHLMENVIYNELKYRGYSIDVGQVEIRETIKDEDNKNKEVKKFLETDFVANEGSKRIYIQSAYSIEDMVKKEHEIKSLLNILDSFKKIVITYDNLYDGYDNNGIYYLDFYRFLMDENSLDK